MDCLGKETVPVSGRSGAQSSGASTGNSLKKGVCWMCWIHIYSLKSQFI